VCDSSTFLVPKDAKEKDLNFEICDGRDGGPELNLTVRAESGVYRSSLEMPRVDLSFEEVVLDDHAPWCETVSEEGEYDSKDAKAFEHVANAIAEEKASLDTKASVVGEKRVRDE
jgi:hypothetical protein